MDPKLLLHRSSLPSLPRIPRPMQTARESSIPPSPPNSFRDKSGHSMHSICNALLSHLPRGIRRKDSSPYSILEPAPTSFPSLAVRNPGVSPNHSSEISARDIVFALHSHLQPSPPSSRECDAPP